MQFGVQFFPSVDHTDKSAADYYEESLAIAEAADKLCFAHARTVEHYFTRYGGYSPNPIVRHFRRAARRRLCARLPAARVPPLRHLARRVAGALPRGPRADRAPAHAGEC